MKISTCARAYRPAGLCSPLGVSAAVPLDLSVLDSWVQAPPAHRASPVPVGPGATLLRHSCAQRWCAAGANGRPGGDLQAGGRLNDLCAAAISL